jgi:SSS family solute:Na+ symporter
MQLTIIDIVIFLVFTLGTVLFGSSFVRKNKTAGDFMTAGKGMSGFVVGMSIFATYVSSISFLALPGSAYSGNWNSFVFSLSIPIAIFFAARFFVPFYRSIDSPSAYSFLEERFGRWARLYASGCYLLTQVARVGSVLFLLALPINAMLGWSIPLIIVLTGVAVVIYSALGGIKAIVYTDAIQSLILIAGAITCLVILLVTIPGGTGELFRVGADHDKFSLGSFGLSLSEPTFWVTLLYGLFINLQNYGIDQNYVQRYKTARDEKSARFSALFGGLLYLPVSLLFFLIGTSLFVYYSTQPLPETVTGDQVFPYFIVNALPAGVTGLLIAAIFAAGMSTVSTSINSSATVVLTDFFSITASGAAGEKRKMKILYATSVMLGLLGVGVGLAMISVKSALDAWWSMAAIFSGGMLGLFFLGYIGRRVKGAYALAGVICGVLLIAWMSLSRQTLFHNYLTIVLGTLVIFSVGMFLAVVGGRRNRKR